MMPKIVEDNAQAGTPIDCVSRDLAARLVLR